MGQSEMVLTQRRHLVAEIERCQACGDRRGLADATASLRILGYLFDDIEEDTCS